MYPELTYVFKHALTCEVVFDSILSKNKKRLHRKIATSIEKLYAGKLEEKYRILAEHYIAAENYAKGCEYAKLTAKSAARNAALNDAITYTEKRIAALEKLPQTDSVQKDIIDSRTALGLYFMQYNYHVEAKAAVEPIFNLAVEKNYQRRLSQIHTIIGTYDYMVDEDIPKACEHLSEGLRIAEVENDIASSFFVNHFYGIALSLNCEFDKALICFEQALDISAGANSSWGVAAMKCMISYFIHWAQGQVDRGYQISAEALSLANLSGDIFSKALSHTTHGVLSYGKGSYNDAKNHLTKGVELCKRINLFFWNALAQSYLGEVCYSTGEYRKSAAYYAQSISLLEEKQIIPCWVKLSKMGLTKANAMHREAGTAVNHLVAYEHGNQIKFCSGLMQRCLGEIYLNMGSRHLPDADAWLSRAIGADTENGMLHNLGLDYALYSHLCLKKGGQAKAAEHKKKAIEIFSECGSMGIRVR